MAGVKIVYSAVSFRRTPLVKVSSFAQAIERLGWREYERGDPWTVLYGKEDESGDNAEVELRGVVGDFWLSSDDIRALRGE
jgi:hypothetical protein